MSLRILAVAALVPLALAFSDTSPILSWSSHSSNTLNALPSKFSLDSILSGSDICGHDAIVFIDQPDLHAADLRTLSPDTHLARALASAPSSRQLPYVSSVNAADISELLESAAARCESRYVSYAPEQDVALAASAKHVVSLQLPPLGSGLAQERKDALLKHDALLSTSLSALASTFPNHIVILTSSAPLSFAKRAAPILTQSQSQNTTTGGILAHYQLLTPGLITTLLITFFVLVPVVMVGIQALASIQSPLRADAPKGFDATEKKNQ